MDSFVRLYAIYRSVARWRVALRIYQQTTNWWKLGLWISKALFAWFAWSQFYFVPHWPHFLAMLASACVWAWCFDRSRRSAFAEQYRLYPERIKYFEHDYQYIRYLQFREKLQQGPYVGSLQDAVTFLNNQIETNSQTAISAHPVISVLIGTVLAVLGAGAGQWPAKYIVYTLLGLLVALYFSAMVLGMLQTKQANLKEFKRFLLWAQDEQIGT